MAVCNSFCRKKKFFIFLSCWHVILLVISVQRCSTTSCFRSNFLCIFFFLFYFKFRKKSFLGFPIRMFILVFKLYQFITEYWRTFDNKAVVWRTVASILYFISRSSLNNTVFLFKLFWMLNIKHPCLETYFHSLDKLHHIVLRVEDIKVRLLLNRVLIFYSYKVVQDSK